jgi:hypothetical protein
MIPYEELVAALANWRAKQGLPVVPQTRISSPVMSASYAAPTPAPAARTSPPVAPPARTSQPVAAQPAPDMTVDEDVDEAALLEEAQYEPEGDDFAMAFGRLTGNGGTGESTNVGVAPAGAAPPVGTGDVTLDETDDLPPPPRPTAKKKRNW